MNKTEWKEFSEDNHKYRIRAIYGWQKLEGNPEAYWSVTAEKQQQDRRGFWREDSFGTMPEEIKKWFPELVPTLKWHLCLETSGPMHYRANAKYWLELHLGKSKFNLRPEDPNPLDAFKRTVVFDESVDTMPTLENLKDWCEERLPRLIKQMHADIDTAVPS